jgi:hypothetical protein
MQGKITNFKLIRHLYLSQLYACLEKKEKLLILKI